MEGLLNHVFTFAESYTVILLWVIGPIAGAFAYYRYHRWWRQTDEGKDAKDRRAA